MCSGNQCSIPNIRADFPRFGSKIVEHSRYLPSMPYLAALGKLGENSDRSGSIVGNQAEYSDKTENDLADAASRAGASMQMMEIGIASYTMKNIVLPGISLALEICPNLGPNVFWVKIRTRGSQPRICVRIFAQFTTRAVAYDAVHGAFMTLPPYTREDERRQGA